MGYFRPQYNVTIALWEKHWRLKFKTWNYCIKLHENPRSECLDKDLNCEFTGIFGQLGIELKYLTASNIWRWWHGQFISDLSSISLCWYWHKTDPSTNTHTHTHTHTHFLPPKTTVFFIIQFNSNIMVEFTYCQCYYLKGYLRLFEVGLYEVVFSS